jgi:antitoxin component YwqK of YwqJK toxin-antitoxin module
MGIFDLFGSSLSPFEQFHENGKVKIKDKKGQLSGLVQYFSEKGFLTCQTNYVKGNKVGPEKEFYESGEIKITRNFKSNLLDGDVNSFAESGKITSKYQYKNGLLDGKYFLFDESEDINESGLFINDEKVDILNQKPIYDKDGFRGDFICH